MTLKEQILAYAATHTPEETKKVLAILGNFTGKEMIREKRGE